MSENCPICKTVLTEKKPLGLKNGYDCPQCGCFIMSDYARDMFPLLCNDEKEKDNEEKMAIISHAIRKMQKEGTYPALDKDLIKAILKRPLPKPAEQKDIFIRWIGDNSKAIGDDVRVTTPVILAIIGARTAKEFYIILNYVKTKGIVDNKTVVGGGINNAIDVTLTYDGWEYYQELKRGNIESRKAFMAMEYGDKELDEIVENHFKLAVACTGFELYRLNEKPKAGLIDDRLRVEIRNSRFLIADLTHENRGAYWEAGYAEGLGKPVIYTCMKEKFDKEKSHFDTNHHLTVPWDSKNPQEAIEALKATIRATLPDEAKLTDD
ncbi:MAG: hypothetical protein NTW93_01115 [Phycisphaerae bacterium]|nr:hypothetical protein [Phycisphaerae bacterium]